MPNAPARPCRVPLCRHVVTSTLPCPVHGAPQTMRWSTDRRQDVKRLRGRANQERRLRVFARDPLCYVCQQAGRVTLATIAEHIEPLAEAGVDDTTNLSGVGMAGICEACHREKTQRESQRGQLRVSKH